MVFSIIMTIVLWVGIPLMLIYAVLHRRRGVGSKEGSKMLTLSREDEVSQWFFLLTVLFVGVTLLVFNRDFGDPLSWRFIILLTCIVGLTVAYYFKAVSTLFFSLLGIASWWNIQSMYWIGDKNIKTYSIFVGCMLLALLYYVIGQIYDKQLKYKRFSRIYVVLGIVGITMALFFFSSQPGLDVFATMTRGTAIFASWEMVTALLFFFLALVGATIYAVHNNRLLFVEGVAVLVLMLLFGVALFLPEQIIGNGQFGYLLRSYGNELSGTGMLWAIVFNIVVFFELVAIILSGYVRKEAWLINLGIVFLFILIIIKYFDWFFTFLDKSLFFIGAGILLFALGWFMEKGRRQIVAQIKTEVKSTTT